MDMFTREESLKFLSENLEIDNVEQRLQNDRRSLLDEIATNIQTHLPFQNLRLLSEVPEKRHRPSLQEIKADILSGVGGLCFNLNIAAYFLLKAIGFKATIAHATCTSSVIFPNNHVVVYVDDVERTGDKFLIEVGFGFPTFRAVSLNFENESPQFVDSFIEYKYMKYQGRILRMHRKGDLVKSQGQSSFDGLHFVIDDWRRFYHADPDGSNNVEEFFPSFEQVFTNPKASPFHSTFRVICFPGKKAVMVINEKTLIENDKGELVPSNIEGGDAGIIQTVKQYFPIIPEELMKIALTSWRQTMQS
uniref:arylamine N-acetyltransferase n=1 Tax=Arion vulgaris TaxID=1028688 RepID=A0A0B7AMS0_9EUPU